MDEEWKDAVRDGTLGRLLRSLNPMNKKRPWKVLCDGEGFLRAKNVKRLYERHSIQLWSVPPRSPDLNPVEKFWSWLRRELRAQDLRDMRQKKAPLTKAQYTTRVRSVMCSAKAQQKAANIARGVRKTCKEVIAKKGAACRG